MNLNLIYNFPDRIKRIYLKYFPNDTNVTYANLPYKINANLSSSLVDEEDEIPNNDEEVE